jgi:hypothetical protein
MRPGAACHFLRPRPRRKKGLALTFQQGSERCAHQVARGSGNLIAWPWLP